MSKRFTSKDVQALGALLELLDNLSESDMALLCDLIELDFNPDKLRILAAAISDPLRKAFRELTGRELEEML